MEKNSEDIRHVVPVNDLEDHITECYPLPFGDHPVCNCKCKPKHQLGATQEKQYMIVIHNSFDGREGVEWANEILNK